MDLTPHCRHLLLLLLACCCSTAAAHDRPQILVISSADSMLPAGRILSDEVRQGLEGGLGHEVDIFVESLDALRFPEPIFGDMVAALVEAKYHGKRFDLVYALGPHAYHFVAERRAAVYLSAPVIYLAMRDSTIEGLPALSNATGIISRFDLLETVRLARLLQPGLKDLVVITGSSAFARSWEEAARRELAALSNEQRKRVVWGKRGSL